MQAIWRDVRVLCTPFERAVREDANRTFRCAKWTGYVGLAQARPTMVRPSLTVCSAIFPTRSRSRTRPRERFRRLLRKKALWNSRAMRGTLEKKTQTVEQQDLVRRLRDEEFGTPQHCAQAPQCATFLNLAAKHRRSFCVFLSVCPSVRVPVETFMGVVHTLVNYHASTIRSLLLVAMVWGGSARKCYTGTNDC